MLNIIHKGYKCNIVYNRVLGFRLNHIEDSRSGNPKVLMNPKVPPPKVSDYYKYEVPVLR
jgi:hypothetical protein